MQFKSVYSKSDSRIQRNVAARSCTVYIPSKLLLRLPLPPLPQHLALIRFSLAFGASSIRILVISHPVGRKRFLATGPHSIPFPTCPQVAARLSAPLSSRRSIRTPSTLRDHRRPPTSPSIFHQISIINLRSVVRMLSCQE
jgi:hypothetical protein